MTGLTAHNAEDFGRSAASADFPGRACALRVINVCETCFTHVPLRCVVDDLKVTVSELQRMIQANAHKEIHTPLLHVSALARHAPI
jgi:hypothetical protein